MLIGTGRGQQKRGIVARFLVPTCIVMNKNVFMCMHWITLNVFKLVLALQRLFQNNYHRRKAKNYIFTKSTDTMTVLIKTFTAIEKRSDQKKFKKKKERGKCNLGRRANGFVEQFKNGCENVQGRSIEIKAGNFSCECVMD